MVSRFLITTALEETWPADEVPVLFLGEWCRLYDRKPEWEKRDAVVAPYHWDDRERLYKDYLYLQTLYEDLLSELTRKLNILHGVNHSVRYWRIIVGLVNNAANNPKMEEAEDKNFSRLENFALDTWNQDVAVGLTGAFLCAKHYGSKIAQNPEGGSIVNISSDLGLIAPDQRLYMKDGLSEELQPVKPVTYSVVKTGRSINNFTVIFCSMSENWFFPTHRQYHERHCSVRTPSWTAIALVGEVC